MGAGASRRPQAPAGARECQRALLVDVATKVLADNLAALLNRAVRVARGQFVAHRQGVNDKSTAQHRPNCSRVASVPCWSQAISLRAFMTGASYCHAAGLDTFPADHSPETLLTPSLTIAKPTSGRLKFSGLRPAPALGIPPGTAGLSHRRPGRPRAPHTIALCLSVAPATHAEVHFFCFVVELPCSFLLLLPRPPQPPPQAVT